MFAADLLHLSISIFPFVFFLFSFFFCQFCLVISSDCLWELKITTSLLFASENVLHVYLHTEQGGLI